MKKLFSLLLALVLILPLSVAAVQYDLPENTYFVAEMNLTVAVPDKFDILLLSEPVDSSVLRRTGLSQEEIHAYLRDNDLYLDAITAQNNYEFTIAMKKDRSLKDMDDYSRREMDVLKESLRSGYESSGMEVYKLDAYYNGQFTFIEVHARDRSAGHDVMQILTTRENKGYAFTYHSYVGDMSEDEKDNMRRIIRSVRLLDEPYHVSDHIANLDYELEPYWGITEEVWNNDGMEVTYTNLQTDDQIYYSSEDIWSGIPESQRRGLVRSDINNSLYTDAQYAEFLEVSPSQIRHKTYGRYSFVMADISIEGQAATMAVLVKDGKMYCFGCPGGRNSSVFRAMERMLRTVEYTG